MQSVGEVAKMLGVSYRHALRLLRALDEKRHGTVLINRSSGRVSRWVVRPHAVRLLTKGEREEVIGVSLMCESDGMWIAEVPHLGVSVVGTDELEAFQRAKVLAMQKLTDRLALGDVDFDGVTFRATA
jgi:hypothetical protein